MRLRGRLFVTALAGVLAVPAAAQTVAITNARVVVGDGSAPIENGTVVIRNGRIVAAGAGVSIPGDARRVDAGGNYVTPGIIAGFSRVGLVEVDASDASNDASANASPFSAAIDVSTAINPLAVAVSVNRSSGVTRAIVAPETGRSMFGGQGAVIDLGSDMQPITYARAFQFVEFGEEGARNAGGSRASAHALFRNALREARDLGRNSGISGGTSPGRVDQAVIPGESQPDARLLSSDRRSQDVLLTRFDAAALVPVLQGRQILMMHVERASDILQAIALRREFPALRMVFVGASEGWTVAREIAAARVPVIASALNDLPSSFEQLAATQSNVARMKAAGVDVSIGMINDNEARQVRLATQYAGNLVAVGRLPGGTPMSWGEAFAAISSGPAEALGLGGQLGSLRAGRRADVVIWDGDPLESANPTMVMIDGVEQPITNRQTKLRDRYRNLDETQRPKAYDR